MAELRQAEIQDRLGDVAQARGRYARFMDLWREADPELAPTVERARARLETLRP